MGFLDKVKRAVTGPVKIDIDVPDTFRWSDESLAIQANLTNATDKPLVVAEVRFTLQARSSVDKTGATSRLKLTVPGPFALDQGETVARTVEFALTREVSTSTMERAAVEAGLPAWTGRAMKGIVGDVARRSGPHQVSVVVKLDGSSRLSTANATTSAG